MAAILESATTKTLQFFVLALAISTTSGADTSFFMSFNATASLNTTNITTSAMAISAMATSINATGATKIILPVTSINSSGMVKTTSLATINMTMAVSTRSSVNVSSIQPSSSSMPVVTSTAVPPPKPGHCKLGCRISAINNTCFATDIKTVNFTSITGYWRYIMTGTKQADDKKSYLVNFDLLFNNTKCTKIIQDAVKALFKNTSGCIKAGSFDFIHDKPKPKPKPTPKKSGLATWAIVVIVLAVIVVVVVSVVVVRKRHLIASKIHAKSHSNAITEKNDDRNGEEMSGR